MDNFNGNAAFAEECDWLDVSYSERNYVETETQVEQKPKARFKMPKILKIAAIALVCVGALVGLLFIDADFGAEVFKTAKTVYSSSAVELPQKQGVVERKVEIPCNVELIDVKDGVATFGGGKAALCFAQGTVTDKTESSVTVKIDDETSVVYDKLTTIFVNVGDTVSAKALLGKYQTDFSVSVIRNGAVVTEVVGSSAALTWNV